MVLIDNLKAGFTAMWNKSKAYANSKVNDSVTSTDVAWSGQKVQTLVNNVAQELWEDGGWYKGETTVVGLDSLFFTTPSSTWYKPGVYTLTEYSATLGTFSVAGGSILVYPVRVLDDLLGTAQVYCDIMGNQQLIRRCTSNDGWGVWERYQPVEQQTSTTDLSAYVNSLS